MTAPQVTPDFSRTGNSVFENVYIYGNLYAEGLLFAEEDFVFKGNVTVEKDLKVLGKSYLEWANVNTFFGVGVGNSFFNVNNTTKRIGISTEEPVDRIQIKGDVEGFDVVVSAAGTIGLGLTQPGSQERGGNYIPSSEDKLRLDVDGSIAISETIYDSDNLPGANGAYLSRDATGLQWVTTIPTLKEGIKIQEEGNFIVPVPADSDYATAPAVARSFSTINFVDVNSLGVNTTTIQAIADPDNPGDIVRIKVSDLWGYTIDEGSVTNEIYRMSNVGIQNNNPAYTLDVTGTFRVTTDAVVGNDLQVSGDASVQSELSVSGISRLASSGGITTTGGDLFVGNNASIKQNLNVNGDTLETESTTFNLINSVAETINLGADATTINIGNNGPNGTINLNSTKDSSSATTGSLIIDGGVGIAKKLNVGSDTLVTGTLELESTITDYDGNTGTAGRDFRLSSSGVGVTWRPPGVQTKRTIWVSQSGDDSNSGLLEGDAKRTIGAAAAIADANDTIVIRPGTYDENNPIGLRTDVSITGQDLRLVTVRPQNLERDIFHVRRGCLIENLNFACKNDDGQPNDGGVSVANTGGAAVAFPPPQGQTSAVSGYTAPGPATDGPSGRWRSPYVRNCTNFMTKSIGMKIDGDHATASIDGANLKSMVCDSFTQYNEAGIGVSITNDAYAQLVSIFTINCDIGIFAASGGQCDLTNSNSSFGNFGLKAVGLGDVQYTGSVNTAFVGGGDAVILKNIQDNDGDFRRPFDGQAIFFKINLDDYADADGSGVISSPLEEVFKINLLDNPSNNTGFSAADPPSVVIRDSDDLTIDPKGPLGIIAQLSANVDNNGSITSIDVVTTGRNYLPTQNLVVDIEGNTGIATVVMKPIYFTVESATPVTSTGISTVTFNEFIPYSIEANTDFDLRRISRILTSSHSFEYIGTGTSINTSLPFQGGIPIKENEVVAEDGAQIPFTSTDQQGNFDIGEGIQVNQTTSTITGDNFSRAIQAEVTPLILALALR